MTDDALTRDELTRIEALRLAIDFTRPSTTRVTSADVCRIAQTFRDYILAGSAR